MLKISALSWRLTRSVILVFLVTAISVSAYPGPIRSFLPRLPTVPYVEGAKQVSLNHCVRALVRIDIVITSGCVGCVVRTLAVEGVPQIGLVAFTQREINAGVPRRNSAQLPAFLQPVAFEGEHVNGVERDVVAKIEAAVAFVRIPVIGIGDGGGHVIETETAIRIRAVNAVRPGVRELVDQIRGRPMRKPDLQRVVSGIAAGVESDPGNPRPERAARFSAQGRSEWCTGRPGVSRKVVHTVDHRSESAR